MSINTLKRYQVTLNLGRTDTVDIMADSLLDVKSIYDRFSMSNVTLVKRYDYFNTSPLNDAFTQSYRELKILVGSTKKDINKFIIVRFVKPSLSKESIMKFCKTFLQIDGSKVDYVHGMTLHK